MGTARAPSVRLSGVRVLVIEDEMMVSMLVEDMLSDIGCTPIGSATRINQALKLIEDVEFDLDILDVNLNGDETYVVADALAARAIPFVFASGYSAAGMREEYRRIPRLAKPFQQNELARTIAAALGRPSV